MLINQSILLDYLCFAIFYNIMYFKKYVRISVLVFAFVNTKKKNNSANKHITLMRSTI